MKKISIMALFILLISIFAITASAAGVNANTDSKSCAQGSTITLNVALSGSVSAASGGVEVVYDSTKLELVEGTWNTSGAILSTFDMSKNKGAFAYASATSLSGKIFSVKFKILSNAPVGDTEVKCILQLKDASGNAISVTSNAGKVSITCNHSFTKKTTDHLASPASCTSAAKYYYTCAVCDEKGTDTCTYTVGSALGHNYSSVVTAPTCTTSGYTTHICSRCSDTYTDTETTKLGHDMSSATCTEASKCKRTGCNHTEGSALGHNYSSVVTAPTCTAGGYTTHTCSRCNDSYTDTQTTKLGHDMSSATCTEASKCKRTGCNHTEGSTLGHNYSSVVTAPTCTAGGYTTHTCSRCNDSYTDTETTKLGHDMSSATCTEASKCKRTGCTHTEGSALGHSFVTYTSNNDATCTADGTKTAKCERCTVTDTVTDANTKLGHNYSSVVTAPTCTTVGYTTHTCSRCNNSYTNDETLELGHSWNAGVVEKEPTIYEVGKKLFTCTVCSATKTEDIPELTAAIGDVDGNGEITSSDAVHLLMHTFYPEDYPVEQESDFNGDGSVNSSDAIYLLMYTFYPEDYPLMQSSQTPAILTNRKKED